MLMDAHNTLGFLIHDVSRGIRYGFDARARKLGVTRPQWRALLALARREGITQSELAELLDVERITLCRMIDRMADAGLVERRADPADRRVWRLHLTEKAHPLVQKLCEIGEDVERELLACLTSAEQLILRETLVRVRNHSKKTDNDINGGAAG